MRRSPRARRLVLIRAGRIRSRTPATRRALTSSCARAARRRSVRGARRVGSRSPVRGVPETLHQLLDVVVGEPGELPGGVEDAFKRSGRLLAERLHVLLGKEQVAHLVDSRHGDETRPQVFEPQALLAADYLDDARLPVVALFAAHLAHAHGAAPLGDVDVDSRALALDEDLIPCQERHRIRWGW